MVSKSSLFLLSTFLLFALSACREEPLTNETQALASNNANPALGNEADISSEQEQELENDRQADVSLEREFENGRKKDVLQTKEPGDPGREKEDQTATTAIRTKREKMAKEGKVDRNDLTVPDLHDGDDFGKMLHAGEKIRKTLLDILTDTDRLEEDPFPDESQEFCEEKISAFHKLYRQFTLHTRDYLDPHSGTPFSASQISKDRMDYEKDHGKNSKLNGYFFCYRASLEADAEGFSLQDCRMSPDDKEVKYLPAFDADFDLIGYRSDLCILKSRKPLFHEGMGIAGETLLGFNFREDDLFPDFATERHGAFVSAYNKKETGLTRDYTRAGTVTLTGTGLRLEE